MRAVRSQVVHLGAAFVLVATTCGTVHASELAPYSRSLTIRHELRGANMATTRVIGEIKVTNAAGAHALRAIRVADYLAGGTPESFESKLVRANGYEQALRATESGMVDLPKLHPGDVLKFEGMSRSAGRQFGGGFVASRTFPRSEGFDRVEITISAPTLAQVKHDSRFFEAHSHMNADGETLRLVLSPRAIEVKPSDADAALRAIPYYAVSAVPSADVLHAALLEGLAAKPHRVTEIGRQARDVVSGKQGKLDEAHALLEWLNRTVQRNDYTLMSGNWPPADVVSTLARRAGSAVEIARLYQALLAERDIRSELVLTRLHEGIGGADIVVPNHDGILIHLADLGLYADISATTPMIAPLGPGFAGRTAYRFAPDGVHVQRFPALRSANNAVRVFSEMSVGANGDLVGQSRTEGIGPVSATVQGNARKLLGMDVDQRNRYLLERQNMVGQASIMSARMMDQGNAYSTEIDFRIKGETGKDGSITIPVFAGPRYMKGPQSPFIAALREDRDQPFPCYSEELSQHIVIHMPDAYALPRLPGNISVEMPNARYSAQYSYVGRAMKVSRRLVLDVPTTTCTREMAKEMAPALRAAARDMSRRIVIRGPEE